nr:hypothetical protein [Cellulosimicrobium sp. MM]
MPFRFSWAFVVRPLPPGRTAPGHVCSSASGTAAGRRAARRRGVQPVSFLMTQKMLRGVRARAERP